MIQICNVLKKNLLLIIIFSSVVTLFAESNWVIGAQKFVNQRGKNTSVTDGIGEMFPTRILEKLSTNLYRNISTEEKLYKTITELKNQRTSLFLQLSGEVKKRDSLILGNYTQKELERKISEYEKSINEIQKKIDENLLLEKEINNEISISKNKVDSSDGLKISETFFNDIFKSDKISTSDKVVLYKQDFETLYKPSKIAMEAGYESAVFENEIIESKINGLITGKMSIYGEYYSITVELYVYPGAYKVATVTEVGSLSESDLISSLVARELTPAITNSLPIKINFDINPKEIENKVSVYLDNELIKNGLNSFVTDSGVHTLQFVCDSYNSLTTSYNFIGNMTYDISVNMTKTIENEISLQLPARFPGSVFLQGLSHKTNDKGQASVSINNQQILGIFISENNEKAFFVISEDNPMEVETLVLDVNPFNRSEYIEKHRRRMYTSYSVLMTSLIPTFISMGQANNYNIAYYNGSLTSDQLGARTGWTVAQYGFTGVTVGCGIWFVYELVRYFMAADSVLPVEAKIMNEDKILNFQTFEVNLNIDNSNENNEISEE